MGCSKKILLMLAFMAFTQVVYASAFKPRMEETRCADEGCDKEKWGYVEVKPGGHMFWWLYYTTHPDGYQNRPWIIWLQGGPGLSGTGLGNFLEIGSLDQNLTARETTWLQEASLLFIDQPVGTGYSYVENYETIPVGINNITFDVINCLDVFLQQNPEFQTPPLYLFGQSYGGKYGPALAYHIKQTNKIEVNLRGVGIGNGFVSPLDVAENFGPLLYHMGYIDDITLAEFKTKTGILATELEAGRWENADDAFWQALSLLRTNVPGLNIYDIMDFYPQDKQKRALTWDIEMTPLSIYDVKLKPFMDSTIREKLGIIPDKVEWSEPITKYIVNMAQAYDRARDIIFMVDWLLNNTDVQINVYEGNLDLICETAAAVAWVDKLTWSGIQGYRDAKRTALISPDTGKLEMFVKAHDNLRFYWIIGAGHAVPADAPETALRMVKRILNDEENEQDIWESLLDLLKNLFS